jgi:hypothetical protein
MWDDGTTAIVALMRGSDLWVANAGDSRAVLVRDRSVRILSEDHKPNKMSEASRIRRAGGHILWHGVWRVEGVLAVSRAIGDRPLKPYVISDPDVVHTTLGEGDRYIVIATDGLWDVASNVNVAVVANRCQSAREVPDGLVSYALQRKTGDNVTVLAVDVRPKSLAEAAGATETANAGSGRDTTGSGGGTQGSSPRTAPSSGSQGAPIHTAESSASTRTVRRRDGETPASSKPDSGTSGVSGGATGRDTGSGDGAGGTASAAEAVLLDAATGVMDPTGTVSITGAPSNPKHD